MFFQTDQLVIRLQVVVVTNFIRMLMRNVFVNVFTSDAVIWWAAIFRTSSPLPAGWQFTDLQLGPGECARISASDLSALSDCWEVSPQRAARNLVGPPRHWRSFHGSTSVAPFPGHQRKRAARRAKNTAPQLQNHMAAIGLLHKGVTAPWILPNRFTGTSSALLRPFNHLGRY